MLQSELAVTAELIQKCVNENARNAIDQAEYQRDYNGLAVRFNEAQTLTARRMCVLLSKMTRK